MEEAPARAAFGAENAGAGGSAAEPDEGAAGKPEGLGLYGLGLEGACVRLSSAFLRCHPLCLNSEVTLVRRSSN